MRRPAPRKPFDFHSISCHRSAQPDCIGKNVFSVSLFAGQQKLRDLHDNANWFRSELRKLGVEVLGDEDSPVMPVMLYNPAKIPAFSRECLKRNVSVPPFLTAQPVA